MEGTRMIGYWVATSPVKPSHPDVRATVYVKTRAALVALASWAEGDLSTTLTIDWKALGLDSSRATLTAPRIDGFQPARSFRVGEPIPVPRGKGWLLTLAAR
jgi:hypothetical protein